MIRQPTLRTRRLGLRPFAADDACAVSEFAGDPAVARDTLNIPHPYAVEEAEEWIASLPGLLERERSVNFAITHDEHLVGAVGLILELGHQRAELGYWIARPRWSRGFATEAAAATVVWGFEALDLARIHAHHFSRNPASGRVLEKIGMRHEGVLRRHVRRWGELLDLELYGLLRDELPDELKEGAIR